MALSLLVVLSALLVFWLGSPWGDPVERGLTIVNRTDEPILVYAVAPKLPEVLAASVPPHTSVSRRGLLKCPGELVARTEDGTEIARRGPFRECNLKDWIIGAEGAG